MNNGREVVPFPLFHGTSSHHLGFFKPDSTPEAWPHKTIALGLLRDAWAALEALGHERATDMTPVLNQVSGDFNWQHGELYLTPSKLSAVRYARRGARYGGELLTFCKEAVDILGAMNPARVSQLLRSAGPIAGFLQGNGWPPILVQFDDIPVDALSSEAQGRDVSESISLLVNEDMREVLGQQTNFRLATGFGVVTHVFEVEIEDTPNPLPTYDLKEVRSSVHWC